VCNMNKKVHNVDKGCVMRTRGAQHGQNVQRGHGGVLRGKRGCTIWTRGV
jgi:hypothetical protein